MDIPVASKFKHELKTVGERLLVEATCLICGASKSVPFLDGSIEEWEPVHLLAHRINRALQPNDKRLGFRESVPRTDARNPIVAARIANNHGEYEKMSD